MLCISLAETCLSECTRVLDGLDVATEMVEVRIDLISERGTTGQVSDDELLKIYGHEAKKIATCRDLKVAGFSDERKKLLLDAMKTKTVQMLDLEFEAPADYKRDIVACALENSVELIISYHNYKETPSSSELKRIIDECFTNGSHIAKIACLANDARDAARILSCYDDSRRIVALGMGEAGMITRVAATSLGSPFTFVSESVEKATAPGQLTLCEMRDIQQTMSRRGEPKLKKNKSE